MRGVEARRSAPSDFALVPWSSPFDRKTVNQSVSNKLDRLSNGPAEHGNHGASQEEGAHWFRVASPKTLIRDLAEKLMPGQPAKVHYPRLHHALLKHTHRITERRVRSIYQGECDRVWDDEITAIRRELAAIENARARAAFARAAADLSRGLAECGCPLTADQERAVTMMTRAAS